MKLKLNDYSPAEVVKIIREWSEMTQTEFAQTLGKTMQTIQRYENGSIHYSMQMFYKIIEEHGLTVTVEKKQ